MIQFFLLKNIIFFLNWILLLVFSEFVNNVRNNKIRLINNKRKAKTAKQTYSVLRINQGIQRFFNIIIHLRRVILNMSAKKKKKRKIDSHDCISLYLHFWIYNVRMWIFPQNERCRYLVDAFATLEISPIKLFAERYYCLKRRAALDTKLSFIRSVGLFESQISA